MAAGASIVSDSGSKISTDQGYPLYRTVDGRGFDVDLGANAGKHFPQHHQYANPRFFRKMFVALSSYGLVCPIVALKLAKETLA